MSDIQKHLAEVEGIDAKINELKASIAQELTALEVERKKANDLLNETIMKEADFSDKDYGCGTVNLETDTTKIKVVVKKSVKWNEDYLKRYIEPMIEQAGKNPEDFIKYKRSVSETAYKGFSDEMKKVFETAREVVPSKPSITFERKV